MKMDEKTFHDDEDYGESSLLCNENGDERAFRHGAPFIRRCGELQLDHKDNMHHDPLPSPAWWFAFALVGGIIYGYNVSLGAILPHVTESLALSTVETEIASASTTLTDALSMVFGGVLADQLGRKKVALAACAASVIGASLNGLASHFGFFLVCRFFLGIGNGLSLLVLPMYISESIHEKNRAKALAMYQMGVVGGCVGPYVAVLIFSSWRITVMLGCLPALMIAGCFMLKFPESPSWRHAQEPKNISVSPYKRPISQLRKFKVQGGTNSSTLEVDTKLALFLGIMLAYTNNAIDICLFYGPEILVKAGLGTNESTWFGFWCNVLSVLALAAGIHLVIRYPRRDVLLKMLAVVIASFFMSGLSFVLLNSFKQLQAICLITSLGLCVVAYQCGPGIQFVLIVNELFTIKDRGKYMSICTFAMSFFSLLINGTMLSFFEYFGVGGTFLGYGLSYSICWVIFYFYLPETQDRIVRS